MLQRLLTGVGASTLLMLANAAYPPNYFLGTCLTDSWVGEMEISLGISSTERDEFGRLVSPFLHSALRFPRYTVEDPRTASSQSYADDCMHAAMRFYGVGASSTNNKVSGRAAGTLVMDLMDWETHALATLVFSILAQEIGGYEVSMFSGGTTLKTAQRMSSALEGACTPTHISTEVWAAGKGHALSMYANESFQVGGIGYIGSVGIYTTKDYVKFGENETLNSPAFFANYWKHYSYDDNAITRVSANAFFNNSLFYPVDESPVAENGCPDGVLGCRNACSKSYACALREEEGKQCLIVILMVAMYSQGYFQATMSNLNIPAYFCFLGFSGAERYAVWAHSNGVGVLFFHFEPMPFHIAHPGVFERLMLPRAVPERVILSTGAYGEHGYGNPTDNPINVDYPDEVLMKYASLLLSDLPINALLTKYTISDLGIKDLLLKFKAATENAVEDPVFDAACSWVRENYNTWHLWFDRMPLCDFNSHISYTVSGCNASDTNRRINFFWNVPDPNNASLPYECDGGYAELPAFLETSRSCEWIDSRASVWIDWISKKPECDSSFYEYKVSDCDSSAKRTITYHWLLPRSNDSALSMVCTDGDVLPIDIKIDCEYMPDSSPVVKAICVLCTIGFAFLITALTFVYRDRGAPIIKRSQYELLMLIVCGGFFTMAAPIAYAGAPTNFRCGLRPILISTGFTSVFGSLVVKSLRVYRVFMQKAMKRTTITLRMMVKVLLIFFLVDAIIIGVWGIAAFPEAEARSEYLLQIDGNVSRIACRSSSFIFTALLMFWKAILLFLGLYLSFLIRKVSVDFQESGWIFASAVVVLFACLVILPLAYMVDLSAAAFYVFLSGMLILCTGAVIALMIVPKLLRLKEGDSMQSNESSTPGSFSISKRGDGSSSTTARLVSAHGSERYRVSPAKKSTESTRSRSGNLLMTSNELHAQEASKEVITHTSDAQSK